jgi:hypothetical protein
LGAVTLSNSVGSASKVAIRHCVRYILSRVIRGPSMGYGWRVDQISLVGCTSIQITATLRYE